MASKVARSNIQLVVARYPALKLPTRSGPMQFFEEFAAAVSKIPEGAAIELNSEMMDEHRCRKYLHLLTLRDPSYRKLVLRTATGAADRRRVFIANPTAADILLGTSQEPRP